MKQKDFTLLLLLTLLCSTLPAGALRVKTENVAPGSRHDFKWIQGKQEISEFSTGVPYFSFGDSKKPGAIFNTRVENIEFIGGRKTITAYRDMPEWVISYMFRPTITKGYINGSKEKKPLPNYAQITQVNVPVMNAGGAWNKNTMNVKAYVRPFLWSSMDTLGRPYFVTDSRFFYMRPDENKNDVLEKMKISQKSTYVSTAGYEKHGGFGYSDDPEYWNRPVDEHPEDFIRANLPNPFTWAYEYNIKNEKGDGFFVMWDICDAHDVSLLLPIRDEEKFIETGGKLIIDKVGYMGFGKGMFNDTVYAPLSVNMGYEKGYEEGQPGIISRPYFSCRLKADPQYDEEDLSVYDNPKFYLQDEDDDWNAHMEGGGAWSFVMKYYTNDLRGKVLNGEDRAPIADRVTENQPSGRPLVRLYDVTAQRYITPDGKTLNAHGSFEVEADGSFEFPALNPSHRYQLSFASYSYGYYEINDIFFDPDKESHDEQPNSVSPRAVIPFSELNSSPHFDQREPGKLYDLEMTLLLNKNDVTTGVANPGMGREVSRVRYFNMQGCESPQPHSGVNVVVTEYSDGGKSTVKKVIP